MTMNIDSLLTVRLASLDSVISLDSGARFKSTKFSKESFQKFESVLASRCVKAYPALVDALVKMSYRQIREFMINTSGPHHADWIHFIECVNSLDCGGSLKLLSKKVQLINMHNLSKNTLGGTNVLELKKKINNYEK